METHKTHKKTSYFLSVLVEKRRNSHAFQCFFRETVGSPPPSVCPEFKNRSFCLRRRYISVKTSSEIQGFCKDLVKTGWFSTAAFPKLEKLGGCQFCAWAPAVGPCLGPACETRGRVSQTFNYVRPRAWNFAL